MSEARISLTAVDQTKAAFDSVRAGLSGLQTRAVAVTGALAGLGVTAWAATMIADIRSTYDEWDELGKAAQRAGFQSAQAMAEFEYAAKLAGVGAAGLETAIGKLSSKMADAAGGNRQAQQLFATLGVSVKDATGQLRATEEVLTDLAQAFAGWKDGPEKSALALDLFGKSGKELIPLLNGGKSGLAELRGEFRQLRGQITDENVKSAEQFNDNLTRLSVSVSGLTRGLSADLLESLVKITNAMVEAAKAGGFFNGMVAGLQTLLTGDDRHKANVALVDGTEELLRLQNALDRARDRGDKATAARLEQRVAAQLREIETHRTYLRLLDDEEKKRQETGMPAAGKPAAPIVRGTPTRETETAYQRLNEELTRTLALQQAEWEWGGKLDEVRRFEVDALAKITAKTSELSTTEQARLQAKAAEVAAQMRANNERDASFRQTMEQAKAVQDWRNKDHADSLQAIRDIDAEAAARIRSLDGRVQEMRDDAEATSLSASMNVSLAEAVEMVAIARLRERQERMVEGGKAWQDVQKEIDRRTELLGLLGRRAEFDRHTELWRSIDQTAHDVWTNMWEGGSNVFKRLGQTLKASLLDLLYQMTVRKWVISIGASMGVPGAATAAQTLGGGASVAGGLGLLGAAGSTFGMGLNAGFSGLIGEAGLMGSLDAGMTALGAGNIAGGLGTLAGTLGPIALGVMLLASLAKGGETRVGGQYRGTSLVDGPSGGQIGGAQALLSGNISGINATLKALGSSNTVTNYVSGLEQSTAGKGFAYAGGSLNTGTVFGQGVDGSGYMNRRGSLTAEEAMAAFQEELAQTKLEAIQASDAVGPLADWVRSLGDISMLTGEALASAVGRIDKALAEKQALEDRLFALTATDAEQLARVRERERAAIDPTNQALLDQIYAQEDLKVATAAAAAEQEKLADAQRQAAEAAARAAEDLLGRLRSVRPFFLTDAENRRLTAADIANGFNSATGAAITPEFVLGLTAQDYRAYYEQFVAQGNQAAIAAMIDLAPAFQTLVQSVQDQINEQLAAQQAILDERTGLETRLLQLQGDTAALRDRELSLVDASNRSLLEQIFALEDQIEAENRRQETLRKAADAARQLRQELGSLADNMLSAARAIRGQDKTPAALQAEFAVLAARAQAGDRAAMALLPGVGQSLATAGAARATTLADARLLRARTASTLELTAQFAMAMADPVVTEVRSLRDENRRLREQQAKDNKSIQDLHRRTLTVFEDWNSRGLPPERAT